MLEAHLELVFRADSSLVLSPLHKRKKKGRSVRGEIRNTLFLELHFNCFLIVENISDFGVLEAHLELVFRADHADDLTGLLIL